MRLLDATAGFGPYRTRVFRSARTAAELVEELEFCGIDEALVYHTAQRFDHPVRGNTRLLEEVAGCTSLAPTWTILPSATVITDTLGSAPLDRYAWPLLDAYPNLYFETAGYLTAGAIEACCQRFGAGRLVFSSGFPDYASGAALLTLAGADLSQADRDAIAHGNLSRLLAEVQL